ncbi:MAG: GlsB/YeaQ/YmgE family stress response membrane protein [Flavobacteriaceae bacterium]|nr:GlsB/YeaQ/YmgE family stress response membrane protein [Flavobacteriaceae bacterium]
MDNLIWFIVIGILAGFLAGRLIKGKGFGLLMNLIIGVGGAILGGWLFGAIGLSFGGGFIDSLITAFLGAIILLYIINLIKK